MGSVGRHERRSPIASVLMPPDFDQTLALDAVRRLCAQGVAATAADVTALLHREDPVDVESVHAVLEDLASNSILGRLQTAAHRRGSRPEWTTSYFPTNGS
jgi:hypothetical protein